MLRASSLIIDADQGKEQKWHFYTRIHCRIINYHYTCTVVWDLNLGRRATGDASVWLFSPEVTFTPALCTFKKNY
jgi:hypothetical protein